MGKRLVRKMSNKIVSGVCAGLADYVGVSLTGLRFLVAFAVMASGMFPGVFFYILCVMLIPKEETVTWQQSDRLGQEPFDEPSPSVGGGHAIGLVFILLGAGILARTYLPTINTLYLVAGALVIIGLTLLMKKRR